MFNWLKNKLAGEELRRKDETIQHYRELLKTYEVKHEEFTRAKLKAEILEMHLNQDISLDDAINKVISSGGNDYYQSLKYGDKARYMQMVAMGLAGGSALGYLGANSLLGQGRFN